MEAEEEEEEEVVAAVIRRTLLVLVLVGRPGKEARGEKAITSTPAVRRWQHERRRRSHTETTTRWRRRKIFFFDFMIRAEGPFRSGSSSDCILASGDLLACDGLVLE